MTRFRRLATGGLIDRTKTLNFKFNGKRLSGFAGDTLASALLANNQITLGRSFKYHRPRGILSAGIEEPNALFTTGKGTNQQPNSIGPMVELFSGLLGFPDFWCRLLL
jgi:methylglutamate dehydrogenase subunit C